jgi:hypothetical protein
MIHPVDYGPSQDYGDNPTKNLPASSWIIQQFGNYQPDGHTGTDYPCPVGTPVRAATDGTVLHVGRLGGTYADNPWWIAPGFAGYTYVVDHGHFIGIYGHCMDGAARVTNGQRVTEGQVLGLSGNTGASTGPHLHFEALPDGYVLNSYMYGRINPATLFSGIQFQSTPTAPAEEDIMASIDELVAALKRDDVLEEIAKRVHTRPLPYYIDGKETGQATTLAAMVGNADSNILTTHRIIIESVTATVHAIFNTAVSREGGTLGGQTSLAAVLAYFDANIEGVVNQVKATPDAGIDQAQVTAAINAAAKEALAGISITLTNEGAK